MLIAFILAGSVPLIPYLISLFEPGLRGFALSSSVVMTFAAIFGTLPIAIGAGSGAELRQPLGIAVVGGLCVSQLLTLFITPVIYIYLDRIDRRLRRRLEPQASEAEGAERPQVVAAE